MKLHSIRWQLPLSYAAIAFIATMCLGVVLLTVLNSHYARLERRTLEARAQNVSHYLGREMARRPEAENFAYQRIANQIQSFAFLTDTRILLYDSQGNIIVDTGSPSGSFISIPWQTESPRFGEIGFGDAAYQAPPSITIMRPEDMAAVELFNPLAIFNPDVVPLSAQTVPATGDFVVGGMPVDASSGVTFFTASSPFGGFDFAPDGDVTVGFIPRSNQSVSIAIRDPNENILGTLNLTEGPAFGRDIVQSVAQGWLLSGTIAVLLAGVAGWMVSLRITEPIVAMTHATLRMTDGDLTVRTHIQRKDELGMLANAFNEMASRIEDTVTALRRFVADAAHELNTPLTALRTNLELALESPNSDSMQRALVQLTRLEGLSGDLLDLSRLEAMSDNKTHQPVNLTALIQETSIVYASRAEQADIEFELDLPDDSVVIHSNANQMRRLLANLLDNAIKFTPEGGTVKVKLEDTEGRVKLCVEDTGIGIPKEDLPQLFSRFHRARNTNTYPGSGLGLAIVKAIVDAHHGKVYAESNGHGTRIMTVLPIFAQS